MIEKRSLFRPLLAPPQFPVRALAPLAEAVLPVQDATRAPVAMCAQRALPAATLAAPPHRDVAVRGTGRRPIVGRFVTVSESYERKTTVSRLGLRELVAFEKALCAAHAEAETRHAADLAA